MTVVTEKPREQDAAPTPFSRLPELILAGVGLAASAVLQGGFAYVIIRSDADTLQTSVLPALHSAGFDVASADADVVLNTLAAWFGFSFILVVLLSAIGFFIARLRPGRRSTGWWFAAAGIICLFGTQLLLYPVAFFFFLSAALFAVRTPLSRRTT